MKSSKLFLASLLAAAAMSVPAFGATVNGITWTDSADGTVRTFTGTATGYVKINGTGTNEGLNGATNVTKVIFNSVGGTGNAAWFTNTTMSQAIELQGTGLVIKGGTNNGAAVFTGAITGGESSSFTWLGDSAAGNSQQFTFSGDLTGFSGSFVRTTASYSNETKTGAIFFGSATATSYSSSATATDGVISNISGTGRITTSAGVVYNYTAASGETPAYTTLSVNNSSITAKTLTFGGGATYTVASALTGQNSTASNNTLTISAGTTTFTGTVSRFGNVMVASGATLAVGTGGSLNLSGATFTGNGGTFALNGGNVVLGNVSRLGDTALLSASTITATSGTVELSGVIKNGTYTIFTGTDSATLGTLSLTAANSGYYDQAWSIDGSTISVTISNSVRDLIWSGATNTPWDTASANWKTSAEATESTTFKNYDSVTFDASTTGTETNIATGVTVTDLTISGGTHRFTVSSEAYVKIAGTASVENGATLILGSSTERTGLLRGAITVRSGGELQFTAIDITGYDGGENSLSSITIDAGGRLYLNHSRNETFAGTLTLNGTLSGKDADTRWDMYGGSSQIVVGEGANALIDENVKLVIRRNNAPITVGADATLTINGQVLKSSVFSNLSGGNGVLVKNGAGKLTLNGNVNVTGVTQNAGTLTIGGAATITTLTVSGGTTTFASSSSVSIGSLSMQTGASATQTSGIVTISGDVRLHTSNDSTTETYTLSGGVLNITKTASLSIAADTTTDSNYNASAISLGVWKNGGVQLAVQGGTLNVLNSQVLVGFDSSAEVAMSSGEMNVKGVVLYGKNSGKTSKLTVTGGRLNVGSAGLITSTASTSNATKTISISDATVGSLDSWSANGSITLGGTVTFDTTKMVASTAGKSSADATDTAGTTITLNGVLSGDGALKKTGAGTLTLNGNNMFTGGIEIEQGVVAAMNAAALGAANNSVKLSGGQLKVGNGTTAVSLNAAAYTIVLSDAYSEGSGVAAIVGTNTANKSSVALATDTKITIELADSVAVSLAAEAAQYQYKIFDATTIVSDSFTIDSFALSEALKSAWRISGYTNGVLTIAAIPEPSVFGLLAGLGALALAGTRRRRKA